MSENDRIVLKAVLAEQKATKASELSDNAYFEIFTAEHILKDFDLSYDEIQSGQVGTGGDGGIDSMYMRIQETSPGVKNTGDMFVGTIHSFCRALLQKYEPLYALAHSSRQCRQAYFSCCPASSSAAFSSPSSQCPGLPSGSLPPCR